MALVTPSTPGAFDPSSASKQARRLSTVQWCLSAVERVCGAWRARGALRSIPVVAVGPPLRVAGVAFERAPFCASLCSVGVTPPSSLLWRHPTSSGVSGFLPVCRWCHPTPVPGSAQRISRAPDAALVTCHGLRPRWIRRSHGRLGSLDMACRAHTHVGIHRGVSMTGLKPFTLAHCSPSPPCVRFVASVTDDNATRGTRCPAKASGARFFPWLTTPSFARRTMFGIRVYAVSDIHMYPEQTPAASLRREKDPSLSPRQGRPSSKRCVIPSGAGGGDDDVASADDGSRDRLRPRLGQTHTPSAAGRRPRAQGTRPRVRVQRPPAARYQWIPELPHGPRAAGQALRALPRLSRPRSVGAWACVAWWMSSFIG